MFLINLILVGATQTIPAVDVTPTKTIVQVHKVVRQVPKIVVNDVPVQPKVTKHAVPVTHSNNSSKWDQLAQCESSGNWQEHGANGFYGGLQFTEESWNSHGGPQYASRADFASRPEQILVAERLLTDQGWVAWPTCSIKLHFR